MPQQRHRIPSLAIALTLGVGSLTSQQLAAAPADARKAPAPAKSAAASANRAAKAPAAGPVRTAIRRTPVVPSAPTPPLPSYQNREAVRLFARDIAQKHQLDEAQVLSALQQARYQPSVAKAIVPPSTPGARNWTKYKANHVDGVRLKSGLKFWEAHEQTLRLAEDRYGVPPEVIVAIIGIETIFGRHAGNFRTIDALSTLAFDYPPAPRNRSEFFRGELESFFVLARETGLNPLEVKGSFAGAIGMGQFMPSSWRRFAVDGNSDGEIDLFHSAADTIASVGNFLKLHGWQRNGFWYSNAGISNDDESLLFANQMVTEGIIPRMTRQQLRERGISAQPSELGELPGDNDLLSLIDLPSGFDKTEYRLGGRNFYAVTRYNRSNFYGMSVMELAQNLRMGWNERNMVQNDNGRQPVPAASGSSIERATAMPAGNRVAPATSSVAEPVQVMPPPPAQLPQISPMTPGNPAASNASGKRRT